jgi:hypothetical protein
LGVEIRVYLEEGQIVFYDVIGQLYERKTFDYEDELIEFVKRRFPISTE